MSSSSLWRMTALLIFLGAAAWSAPAQDASQQSTGDPVADAARKARAEQKTAPKPKKVFTNDDIPSAPPSAPPSAAPAGTDQAAPPQGAAKQGAEPVTGKKEETPAVKGEAYWRAKFKELRARISQTEKELDVLQRELNKDEVQYYPDPQQALMQQHDRSDINAKRAKVDAKQKELDDLNQKLSDTEDDLRKAGGDPGWAR